MITVSMLQHAFLGAALVVASTPIATAGTVDLNFEGFTGPTAINTPYYYSFPLSLTQNGKVKITGVLANNVDTDIRNLEGLAPSKQATALGNTPYNSVPGPGPKGEIRLVGGLLTKVEFLYGSSPGGDSAFGAGSGFEVNTKSMVGQQTNWSQFATNQGQTAGPHTLIQDYPGQSPYFNAVQFNTLRGGQAQVDNVRLTYESVPSILRNPSSITVTPDTYKIYATFHPQGALGAIDIRNFAEAMGVDHFNWVQRIVHYPDNWVSSPNRFVLFTDLLDRKAVDGSTNPTPPGHPFMEPVPEALYDPPAHPNDVYGLYVNNKWLLTELKYDNYLPYYNEHSDTFSWQNHLQTSSASLQQLGFYDAPNLGGHGSYQGQYLEFDTELVGVAGDDSIVHTGLGFRWKSNAILATEELSFAMDPSYPMDIVTGGVFDVEVYAPSVPEPSTLGLAVITSIVMGMYFLGTDRSRSKLGAVLDNGFTRCCDKCVAYASRSRRTRIGSTNCALLALGLILAIGSQPAQANHIGGWDLTRGGGSSILSIGSEYGLLRSLVRAYCPESTFTGTATLTPEYLDTIDILAIGGQTADAPNPGFVSALSTSEQQAMFEFVERGGALVLILEHSGQGGSGGAEARQTFVAPFGMNITGSLNAPWAIITDPSHPIFDGANGTVTGPLFLGQTAYFDNLGPYAHSIANEVLTGQSVLAVIEPHAISPTSGPVVMLADSNALDLQNYSYALVTNALEYLGVTTCVPEPSSLSLAVMALVGAAGAVLMRRRVG